jgi:hypothetical protein
MKRNRGQEGIGPRGGKGGPAVYLPDIPVFKHLDYIAKGIIIEMKFPGFRVIAYGHTESIPQRGAKIKGSCGIPAYKTNRSVTMGSIIRMRERFVHVHFFVMPQKPGAAG